MSERSAPAAALTVVAASAITPERSPAITAPQPAQSLSPAVVLQRLTPAQIIEAGPNVTVYYFIKVGAKAGTVSLRRLPPEVARQCALIKVDRNRGTFNLQWYPHAEQPQIHVELPFSALTQAVDDLCAAGFSTLTSAPQPEARSTVYHRTISIASQSSMPRIEV